MTGYVTTPWGRATVLEQVEVQQEAAGKTFTTHVQLLEHGGGELLVRFAYSTEGAAARRGPVTMRAEDLEALRLQLRDRRRLAKALRSPGLSR